MKMIKPIVNLSKVVENYETILLGFDGVMTEGKGIMADAAKSVQGLYKCNKNLLMLSNSSLRVAAVARILQSGGVSPLFFNCIITAGEILHYKLKARVGDFSAIGNDYYHLGGTADDSVFQGLDYNKVENIESAHFVYMNEVASLTDTIDQYLPSLEHAASLGLPLICTGNDTSTFKDGKICLAPGAVAEQYAVMGGRIITIGKPDGQLFNYCLDAVENSGNVLVIGDNVATDIKGACLLGLDAALISKGVHINFLGEGYIPDVAKARELCNNYDVSPSYVISNLRW